MPNPNTPNPDALSEARVRAERRDTVARLKEAARKWRTGGALTLRGINLEPVDLEVAAMALSATPPASEGGAIGAGEWQWPGLSCVASDEEVTRIADVPDEEVPTPTQAVRWLAKFSNPDEVASTTPRKIANELANICALLTAAPKIASERCSYCDCTGDVHRADGEWLGPCPDCSPKVASEGTAPGLVEAVVSLAKRDIARTQTDFLGRMGSALCQYESIFDEYPDGDLPDDAREDAEENIAALAGLALAQFAMLRSPDNPAAALTPPTPSAGSGHDLFAENAKNPTIPAGMVPWAGTDGHGNTEPLDWDGNSALLRNGEWSGCPDFRHADPQDDPDSDPATDIIAYTPRTTPALSPEPGREVDWGLPLEARHNDGRIRNVELLQKNAGIYPGNDHWCGTVDRNRLDGTPGAIWAFWASNDGIIPGYSGWRIHNPLPAASDGGAA